jgi:hypothetical protein
MMMFPPVGYVATGTTLRGRLHYLGHQSHSSRRPNGASTLQTKFLSRHLAAAVMV